MLRWLTRLFLFGLIAAAVAFALSKLLGREEDFDDFDDIDSSFEFQETPVEIDVPADTAPTFEYAAGGATATAASAPTTSNGTGASVASTDAEVAPASTPMTFRASADTDLLSDEDAGPESETAGEAPADAGKLIDINGIGPAYEARLVAAGIDNIAQLAEADANAIAEQIDVIGGVTTIEDWIGQAKAYVEGKWRGENAGHRHGQNA